MMDMTQEDRKNTGSVQLDSSDARKRIEALAAGMLERERWPRERLLEDQHRRLAEIVRHAIARSPYYREAIGEVGDGEVRLQELPILTKAILMREFDRIVTDPRLSLADAEEHLASERAGELLHGEYRVVGSGGTTGRRGVIVYGQEAWEVAVASVRRIMATEVISPKARVLGIGAPTPLHMTNRLFAELRAGHSDVPRLAVTTPLPEIVAGLNAYRPDVVITYPSLIRRLAEEQAAGRLGIAPKMFSSAAETLTQDVRDLAMQTWGAPVLNVYASTEVNLIGAECPWTTGLHVAEDTVLVEVVDDDDRPVPVGIQGRKVLVTNLFNRTLPIIRYEISDLVTVAEGPCPCGRQHLRLASVQGRREDELSLPAKGGGRVEINAFLLGDTLLHIPAVRQYQLSPQPGRLKVRVVLRDGASHREVLPAAKRAIAAELERAGAVVQGLEVEAVSEIRRTGTGAKEKVVSAEWPADPC